MEKLALVRIGYEEACLHYLSLYLCWSVTVNNSHHATHGIKEAIAEAILAEEAISDTSESAPVKALLRSKILGATKVHHQLARISDQLQVSKPALKFARQIQRRAFNLLTRGLTDSDPSFWKSKENKSTTDVGWCIERFLMPIELPGGSFFSDLPANQDLLAVIAEAERLNVENEDWKQSRNSAPSTCDTNLQIQIESLLGQAEGYEFCCFNQGMDTLIEEQKKRQTNCEDLRLETFFSVTKLKNCLDKAISQLRAAVHETSTWLEEHKEVDLDLPGRIMINNCLAADSAIRRFFLRAEETEKLVKKSYSRWDLDSLLSIEYDSACRYFHNDVNRRKENTTSENAIT